MDSALTLAGFFQQYFAPLYLCDARPRTFEAYHETLAHWKHHALDETATRRSTHAARRSNWGPADLANWAAGSTMGA